MKKDIASLNEKNKFTHFYEVKNQETIGGLMYCLDKVLTTNENGSKYIIRGKSDDYDNYGTITFGRKREIKVPIDSFVVTILDDGNYILEQIPFDDERKCNYLNELKKRNVTYTIPKVLDKSTSKAFTRFQHAVGATYSSKKIQGYFGINGYCKIEVYYCCDDRYKSFEFNFKKNPGSVRIAGSVILSMVGPDSPSWECIEELVSTNVNIKEGQPTVEWIKKARLYDVMEYINFKTDEDK